MNERAMPTALPWEPATYRRDGSETADGPNGRSYVTRVRKGARTWEARVNGVTIGTGFKNKDDAKLACEFKAVYAKERSAK